VNKDYLELYENEMEEIVEEEDPENLAEQMRNSEEDEEDEEDEDDNENEKEKEDQATQKIIPKKRKKIQLNRRIFGNLPA
jgi:triphosphoribosyl-dephospho-CoA synthetase